MMGQKDGPGEQMNSTGANRTGEGDLTTGSPIAETNFTPGNATALSTAELDIITAPGNAHQFHWKSGTITWAGFLEWLRNPSAVKECGGYVLGTFCETKGHKGDPECVGLHRIRLGVVSRGALTLDVDKPTPDFLDRVKALPFEVAWHTTFNSTKDAPRYRLIIRLDRTVNPAEYAVAVRAVRVMLATDPDDDTTDDEPERFMYRPSGVNGSYASGVTEGSVARVEDLLLPDDPFLGLDKPSLPDTASIVAGGASSGERNITLFKLACRLRREYNDDREAVTAVVLTAAARSTPVLPEDEALRCVEQAFRQDHSDTGEPDRVHHGQPRMAYRLAAAYGGKLMYVKGLGWLVWDGRRWSSDKKDAATKAVLDVLRQALDEAGVGAGSEKSLRADVLKCESAAGIAGVLTIASALPGLRFSVDDLDADPHLLNCANGTLDLRTRKLRPHDPADRITKVARGAYDPDADTVRWDEFLERVLPEADDRAYLQRVIGQAVYGRVREHLFPVLTGTGANGKGTFYGAVVNAFGDYAQVIDPKLLMVEGKSGGPEMMVLLGARLVVGSETGDGRRLDGTLMKRLTGGDMLTARNHYQSPVTWQPSHQIVYVTNHKPGVDGNDHAIWRRIRVVPFDVVIPEAERDPELGERLELSADAILTWAVKGWFDYEANGMAEPEDIRKATDNYQTESDAVKRFISEKCDVGSAALHATSGELYEAWKVWAAGEGAEWLSDKAFYKKLDDRGYPVTRKVNGKSERFGIAVKKSE